MRRTDKIRTTVTHRRPLAGAIARELGRRAGPASAAALGVALCGGAMAANINVTTAFDEINVNGQCSLREAVINSNNNDQSGSVDCASGTGDDTINLLAGTFTLDIGTSGENAAAQGDLDITDTTGTTGTTTIQGTDAATTVIDASGIAGGDRALDVRNNASLTLNDTTVTGGDVNSGGGIYNANDTLIVNRSVVSGNSAGNNGGGVFSRGTATLNHSTVSGNTAGRDGGGVYIKSGRLDLHHSEVTGNYAAMSGGGVDVNGGTTTTITHTTVSANTAGDEGGGVVSHTGLHFTGGG